MKKPIIIFLTWIFLSIPAYGDMSHIAGQDVDDLSHFAGQSKTDVSAKGGQTLAVATCTLYTSNSTNSGVRPFAQYATTGYQGFVFDDSSSGTICTVTADIGGVEGDITVNDYYAEVWLLDGSRNLSSRLGTSDKVDGLNTWDYSTVTFNFSTTVDYDCTGTNEYGILVKQVDSGDAASTSGESDSTNWCRVLYNSSNTMTYGTARATWNSDTDAIAVEETGEAIRMGVWTMQ